jgi:very-short-patch-repair endonuclease
MEIKGRRIPPELAALAEQQHNIVSRAQLRRLGAEFQRHYVRAQVEAERWTLPAPNVVALQNTPLEPQQLWQLALSAHGDQLVALAGATAAQAHGLTGFESELVHILVPHGARIHEIDGVKVHESRRFTAEDLHPARRPPMVRVARALIDTAAWSKHPRRAATLLAAGVQQRLTTADRLLEELGRAGRIRHRRLMAAVLHDVAGGAQALSELDLLRLCRKHDLPEPRRQVVRRDQDGRRRWLDAVFILPDGTELVVEVDGAAHMCIEQYADDLDRMNQLITEGKVVLRVAAVTLRLDGDRFAAQLAMLLRPKTCPARRGL